MSRFLLIGPPQIGKSVAANRIADALGCKSIKYEWDEIETLPDGVLAVASYANMHVHSFIPHTTTMAMFVVKSSEGLQALVEAIELKPVTPEQFKIAKQLADIADWIYDHKSYLGSHSQRQEASDHAGTMHTCAMHIAGNRVAEIYSPEDQNSFERKPVTPKKIDNGRVLTCIYCGHEYPQDTPTSGSKVLTDHIKTCELHPMRRIEADNAKLREALVGLVGADSKDLLDNMEATIRALPQIPEDDRINTINAICALRDTIKS